MKNASLVLNGVLLVAVVVLYILHFSGKPSGSNAGGSSGAPSDVKVAYIRQDTVLKYYDFMKLNEDKLRAKAQSFDQQLTARQTSLQREVESYRTNASNLTIGQARTIEENLQQKGQNLQLFQQSLQQQMMEEEGKVATEVYEKLTKYLRDYSKQRGIEVVVKFDRGSDVLFAGDSLDISKDVIKGLNEAWKAEAVKPKADTTKTK